jgi:hypothetical protein
MGSVYLLWSTLASMEGFRDILTAIQLARPFLRHCWEERDDKHDLKNVYDYEKAWWVIINLKLIWRRLVLIYQSRHFETVWYLYILFPINSQHLINAEMCFICSLFLHSTDLENVCLGGLGGVGGMGGAAAKLSPLTAVLPNGCGSNPQLGQHIC